MTILILAALVVAGFLIALFSLARRARDFANGPIPFPPGILPPPKALGDRLDPWHGCHDPRETETDYARAKALRQAIARERAEMERG
jgi:hypothetical protein